jgi:hypothetical protein
MIVVRQRAGRWHWTCHLCYPPANGSRNVWADIYRISLPRHMKTRYSHHEWVARNRIGDR